MSTDKTATPSPAAATPDQDPLPDIPRGGEPDDPAEGPRDGMTPGDKAQPSDLTPSTHVPDTRAFDL